MGKKLGMEEAEEGQEEDGAADRGHADAQLNYQ